MKMRLLIAAFAFAGLLGSPQSLAQNAYVTNNTSNTVSMIDTATNTVTATIPGFINPYGVAVSPDGRKVYVTNESGSSVSVIDTATDKVTAVIPVGTTPIGVAVTPGGRKVYVTNLGANPSNEFGTVSVIDTRTNKVTDTIPIGFQPIGVTASPDGREVYVANNSDIAFSGILSVIDTEKNTVTATIPIGREAFAVAVSPDGRKVYVTNEIPAACPPTCGQSGTVSVIDTRTNTVTATIQVGSVPDGVAVTPDSRKVYVANLGGGPGSGFPGTVSVIDSATDKVIDTIPVGDTSSRGPTGVSVTPDGREVYVAVVGGTGAGTGTVSIIATATNKVTATVPVGFDPIALGVFIQPAKPKFAGTPGKSNCYGKSVSALVRQYHGLNAAAAALGYRSVKALQTAIMEFCEG